uniref:TLC domain-containing protein n=1 Tax=Globisporangium ultimum (strain ATCC 200006 / CBS 805.95 / DAOM BR144) TaxID=431595 RepID=K3W7E3_GLOUD
MMPAVALNLALLLLSMALWTALFVAGSRLSARYVPVYRDFSKAEQGDWCSRVNSTIHAVIIVVGMLTTVLRQQWDEDLMPLRSTTAATALFSFSCGYFLFDLYVLVRWQVPLWRVFVIHHIVAAVPYLIYNFHAGCGMDFYLLSLFLLVELAVIPLNITTFLEQLGYGKTPVHQLFFFSTYVFWFGARVVLPLYNVYVLWERIIPESSDAPFCVIPAAVCGHLIAAFCVGVFVFVWTPDVLAKWRAPVIQLDEYSDYELTLRTNITPRASPLTASNTKSGSKRNYGTLDP